MKKLPLSKIATSLIFSLYLITQTSLALAGTDEAKKFVQGIGDKVINIITATGITEDKKENQLNALFVETVDIDWIAKFVVGRYWRESSPEQQKQYLKLYNDFLIHSYVKKFKEYTNQKLVINKVFAEDDNDYTIETLINSADGKSYNVTYKARQDNGHFKIYDIIAEGVSMITTQRSEFGSILSREGMDALIQKLAKKS